MSRTGDRTALALGAGAVLALVLATTVEAAPPPMGTLWYENQMVRTLVPPSAMPKEGTDPLYMVPGVGGVAGVAPGGAGYHGGRWKVYVAGNVDAGDIAAYGGLNSATEVLQAAADGAITLTRQPSLDFLCPIQP
ncbi:MAG TPA: hypothetical protein VNN10_08265 [Dehalococcoidia bacterium]|nr:hypothetical protein [Dehalococcoidia bacterium]